MCLTLEPQERREGQLLRRQGVKRWAGVFYHVAMANPERVLSFRHRLTSS